MKGERIFLDTNIVVYAYSDDDEVKCRMAREVLVLNECLVSTQVLNEFSNVCVKKLHRTAREVWNSIESLLSICDLAVVGKDTVRAALDIHERFDISYYDSLMVTTAIDCRCSYFISEDLQNGQVFDGVTVKNVFRGALR
jgi:predicted nucleic acid-binding protein